MNPRPNPIANRAGYDLWSAGYDTHPNSTVAADERDFPAQWRGLRGRRVLEVGCGTGRHTGKLAAQGNRVTGLDLSPGMLAVAREKLRDFPEVILREGDFLSGRLFEPQSFDAVVAALVLEHLRDLGAFFAEARRVLVAGGELHVSEIHPARSAGGTLAHFTAADGAVYDLDSVAHAAGAPERAAAAAGFELRAVRDAVGDAALAALHAPWAKHLGRPLVRMWHWTRAADGP
jgi:SAM-dependent methyltransferase